MTPNGSSDHAEGGPATAGPPSFELGRAGHISLAPVSSVVLLNELVEPGPDRWELMPLEHDELSLARTHA